MNLCEHIGCAYWNKGETVDGALRNYGCQRFAVSNLCPLAEIRGTTANQYAIYADADAPTAVETCASALCPDPLVRLKALRAWPLEAPEQMQSRQQFQNTDHYNNVLAEAESLVEHFKV